MSRLLGPQGITKLRTKAKELKLKGKGHEVSPRRPITTAPAEQPMRNTREAHLVVDILLIRELLIRELLVMGTLGQGNS